MIAATVTQHQRMAGTVWTPLPVMGVEATQVATRRLLNNPPSMGASPSAAEEWHHDVISSLSQPSTPRTMREGGRSRR
jgi:hypothetical protein